MRKISDGGPDAGAAAAARGRPWRLTRRETLRILALAGAAGAVSGLGLLGRSRAQFVKRMRVLMGTEVHLQLVADEREAAEAAAEAALGRMAELEALLSRHREDSELSRLHASGRLDGASSALREVLGLADRVFRLGDGAFDVTVQPVLDVYRSRLARGSGLPTAAEIEEAVARVDQRAVRVEGERVTLLRGDVRITLDGVAKGYIVDRAVETLRGRGFGDVFVEAGGDLMAAGGKAGGTPWRVGIRSPRGLALQARFDTTNRAVATSGDYMQSFTRDYTEHHILDPRTGHSAPELASSTVVAPDAATADALATLTMVLGSRRSRALIEELPACEGYFVSKDLAVTRTSGFTVL